MASVWAFVGVFCAFSAHAFEETELRKIVVAADARLTAAKDQATTREARAGFNGQLSVVELRKWFNEPHDFISGREARGWRTAKALAITALTNGTNPNLTQQLAEVLQAITNNYRRPAPESIHFLAPPILFWDHLHNPIARGNTVAKNLHDSGSAEDFGRSDPKPSTFWVRPRSVWEQDLYAGFGRSELPQYETNLWEYAGPKTSWGGCPGFDARCGTREIKVKFFEIHSEPFTARIFSALGYYADPTDYAPFLKLKYSRRLFREFHLRKDLMIAIRALGIRVYTISLQKRYSAFDFIREATLQDGQRLSGAELKRFLLRNHHGKYPEDDPLNFIPDREEQVAFLMTTPVNIQTRETAYQAIGPWSFEGLGHEHLRELRGAGLLAAWVGWYDSRFENTRLKVAEIDGQLQFAHFFNDLGGGLGKSLGVISRPMESAKLFSDTFTSPPKVQGKGRMTIPFRIRNYEPIVDTAAFKEMTVDDARWMARLIGQLSAKQMEDALSASGFNPEDVETFREKLISRRNRLVQDLDLGKDIPPLTQKRGVPVP